MTAEQTIPADVVGHIVKTPGVMSGRPRIANTRIRVMDLAAYHVYQGMSVDDLLENFSQLSPADVHAALAYYFDHLDEIEAAYAEDDEFAEQFKRDHPDTVIDLRGA